MFRLPRSVPSVAILSLIGAFLGLSSCSSGHSNGDDGSAGSTNNGGASGESNTGGKGGALGKGGTSSKGGNGGTASTTSCQVINEEDAPDFEGIDTNCDGVDGNTATSLFVSPQGLDSGTGAKDDPLRTIEHAIEVAQAGNGIADILICEGTYDENLKIIDVPVSLHGGYDCETWARTNGRTQIARTQGVTLRIENVSGPMRLTKLGLQSSDTSTVGTSSQAVQVVKSTAISIDESIIVSGNGAPGADGATQKTTWTTNPKTGNEGESLEIASNDLSVACHDLTMYKDGDLDGNDDVGSDQTLTRCTTARAGGASVVQTCPNPEAVSPIIVYGGKGGTGAIKPHGSTSIAAGAGANGSPSVAFSPSKPGLPGDAFGSVGTSGYVADNIGGDGKQGYPGVAGKGGNGGGSCMLRIGNIDGDSLLYSSTDYIGTTCVSSTSWGGATTNAWTSYAGTQGTIHRNVVMFPGGGGGAGGTPGCGGYGGYGGKGGGASIALLVLDSEITLTNTDVSSGKGGKGGAASAGTTGQLGGNPGLAGIANRSQLVKLPTWNGNVLITKANLDGANGTAGERGQSGSAGGPGGGGPSIAILWDGDVAPVFDTSVTLRFGEGGQGGTPIASDAAAAGRTGDCMSVTDASTN